MRLFSIIITFFCSTFAIFGIPAYPGKIVIQIEGKPVCIRVLGDEYCKWAESEDGYTIIQDSTNRWCYAQQQENGSLIASDIRVLAGSPNDETELFLKNTPKHLIPKRQKIINNIFGKAHTTGNVTGNRRVLIILMEFQDLHISKTTNDFYKLFNQEHYQEDKAQGSVRDFFLAASYGQLKLESDIYGPYKTEHNMAYYGRNILQGGDVNPYAMFEEAIKKVANDTDLSQYDSDGDGYIDNVHIIYAGYGEEAGAAQDAIWAHESTFRKAYEIQGMKIDRYSCAPELRGNSGEGISRIGPHCHEIGHALGAMDFYDTDYDVGGGYVGTGKWDVMAQGSWNNEGISPADFNPYVKAYCYKWIKPEKLPQGETVIAPSNDGPNNYYTLGLSEHGDYYMLENRSQAGWGAGLPGNGLLIYHIHPNIENVRNKINVTAPQLCYIVCASSRYNQPSEKPTSYGDINTMGCPYPGSSMNHVFNINSTPKAFFWIESDCRIDINNIILLDNQDIRLTNNSEGDDHYKKEYKRLFFEDFEHELKIKTEGQEWQLVVDNKTSSDIITQPLAHSGVCSLQLSARDEYEDQEGGFEFECDSMYSEGKITIKGYYTSYNTMMRSNTIRVGYKFSDSDDWTYNTVNSNKDITWDKFEIELPEKVLPKFRISGTAVIRSILALDDIEVLQEVTMVDASTKPVLFSSKWCTSNVKIFSLEGISHSNLGKGVNIIKDKDGHTKKVFVK